MSKGVSEYRKKLRRQAQNAARQAAVEIMNDLAEAGPYWSGNFRNNWVADSPGMALGKKAKYPYKIRDVAKLGDTIVATKKTVKLKIFNSSGYALEALDLKEGRFFPDGPPKGNIVREGERQLNEDGEGIRGDIQQGDGNNVSTAELDWFMTYLKGGAIQAALKQGVTVGFRKEI